jgi:hypothetical protein
METNGEVDIQIYVFLNLALVWVVTFTTRPPYPDETARDNHWIGGWAPGPVWRMGKE